MDYLDKHTIPGDKLFMLESPSVFYFGILTSNVHMAWMRAVCGRLKSDYSYIVLSQSVRLYLFLHSS